MVSGLNQLPALFPFLTKEVFHPFNASFKGIMNEAQAILVALDGIPLLLGSHFRKFMDRDLIFPLSHSFPSILFYSGMNHFPLMEYSIQNPNIKASAVPKAGLRIFSQAS
jgi:hypothetical protein